MFKSYKEIEIFYKDINNIDPTLDLTEDLIECLK